LFRGTDYGFLFVCGSQLSVTHHFITLKITL
jgi:hypothetical protein